MGRRKKEPENVHRARIASAASELFMEKGIVVTTMDEIAKTAGYSKATLYVYFQSKEEVVSYLTLESMHRLYEYISNALEFGETTEDRYYGICEGLLQYQMEYPFYFGMLLDKINIEFENREFLPEEKEIYQVGEKINEKLKLFFISGIERGDLRQDMEIFPAIFQLWGMLSGIIQLASSKEQYIERTMRLSKQQFLQQGFRMLYQSIIRR